MKKHKEKNIRKPRSRAWVFMTILGSAVILVMVVGTIISSQTASARQVSNQAQPQTSDEDATVQFANQKIRIDPQTGKLRKPTADEARALVETIKELTNRSTQGLRVERGSNGLRKVDLQNRFQSLIVAKPNPDGTNEIRCVTSIEEATAFLGIDPSKIPTKDK